MGRVLSLFLPWWAAERVARRLWPARPEALVITRTRGQQKMVAGVCARAHQAGVRPGMSLAQARALAAGLSLHVEAEDTVGDSRAMTALARWAARRWSPIVQPEHDGLLLDISGCAHLFTGERGLARSLGRSVTRLGLTARLAIAPSVGAAWALARFAPARATIIEGEAWAWDARNALDALPVQSLRLDEHTLELLDEVGINNVGQLMDLPRASLPARYGSMLLTRLDQAIGLIHEGVARTPELADYLATRDLPGGTTSLEVLERVVRMLLDELSSQLQSIESGLRRIDAEFSRLDAASIGFTIRVTRPTRDPGHLWSLLRPRVELVDMGFGVERITLRAGGVAKIDHDQQSLTEPIAQSADEAAFAALIDTMANRLGEERVLRAELTASHRPERAFRLRRIDGTPDSDGPSREVPRPPRLIDPPSPAEATSLVPEGPVLRVRWRGTDHTIVHSAGPERLGPEWWQGEGRTRDYFRLQDEHGRWLWAFREESRWYVHGEWS